MKHLAKLTTAAALALAFCLLSAPAANALPIGWPGTGKPCYWNGKGYDHDEVITVRMPDGTYQRYRCVDGEWERERYTSTSSWSSYAYTTAP